MRLGNIHKKDVANIGNDNLGRRKVASAMVGLSVLCHPKAHQL